jgi:L-fucose isomerase
MAYVQKPSIGSTTIGLFAPCDPRIDDESRERALNIVTMTAKILKRVRLPMGHKLGIVVADKTVENEADADDVAFAFKKAGVEAVAIVPDTWFYPGKTAIALTSHFARTTPIACIAGNNAPKPGVVGVDAVVGAYAQTGILCQAIIGNMPETGQNPIFDKKTQAEIVDLGWAMAAAAWLRGKRVFCSDTDSMQMETA